MKDLLLHPLTRRQLEQFIATPSHAVMLVGPAGSGKLAVALRLAQAVLDTKGSLRKHPYSMVISPEDGRAIGIEAVRRLEQFVTLKVPGRAAFDRAIVIEDAHLLTAEAQNALLKILEEPPVGTVLILTAASPQAVLPTVRSRVQTIALGRLGKTQVEEYFTARKIDRDLIAQAYAISGGLPGLLQALINEAEHPLLAATAIARRLLSQTVYDRLLIVDELSKQRALATHVTYILQQMAHVSLQTAAGPAAKKWQAVLAASYEASQALATSAQPKLALTKLMLNL